MKKPTLLGLVLLAICLGATPAFSDSEPQGREREDRRLLEKLGEFEDFEELELDDLLNVTISIAAGRTQTLEEAPSIVSVVTDEEIRRLGARTLEEVLEMVPGVEVLTDNLGRGLIVLRGVPAERRSRTPAAWAARLTTGSSANVLVLFNGHRLNEDLSGGATIVNLDIPVDNIKKVEIIRGPGSALFGANAFLGVINIVTYTADTFSGMKVSVGGGSFDTRQASVLFGKTVGKVSLSGFAQWADTDGAQLLVPADVQTLTDEFLEPQGILPASLAPGPTMDDRRAFDANASLVYGGLTLGGRFKDEDAGGYIGLVDNLGRQNRLQNRQLSLYTDYRRPLGEKGDLRGSFTFTQSEERAFLDPFPPQSFLPLDPERSQLGFFPDGVLVDLELNSRRWGGEVRVDASVFRGNTATFGVGVETESTLDILARGNFNRNRVPMPGFLSLPPVIPQTERRIVSLFAQDTWNPVDRVGVTAGLRWDDYSDFGKTLNPRAAVVLRLPRDLSLKVLYGRAFRAPTFLELFSNWPGTPGDSDLEPMTINTFEVALGYRRRGLRVSANAYANYLRQSIALERSDTDRFVNTPGVDARGVEFELSRSFGRHALRLGYAYQDCEQRITGRPVPDIPHHLASLGGTLAIGKHLSLTPSLLIRGSRPRSGGDREDQRPETDGYTLLNLGVRVREVFQGLELSASVQNGLDEEYFDPSPFNGVRGDYPRPGRKVFVKASWIF
jgi:outer membrane receptor protein involved in Fe transport